MNQIIMILLISALVLVHEIGHFIAARLCGVKVSRFGIGMPIGPSWKMFSWKGTNFYLHAFLFGGYVAFPDDEEQFIKAKEEKKEEKEQKPSKYAFINKIREIIKEYNLKAEEKRKKEEEILKQEMTIDADSPERFENKTIGQKFFIVSAGVLMNVIFAYVLVIGASAYYGKLPTQQQNIYTQGFSEKPLSNIKNYDIQKGDKFYKINGYKINSLYQLVFLTKNSKLFDNYAQEDLIDENLKELKKLNPKTEDIVKAGETINLPATKKEKPLEVNDKILQGIEKYRKDGLELNKAQIAIRNDIYGEKTYTFEENTSLKDIAVALSDTYKPIELTFLRGDKEIICKDVQVGVKGLFGIALSTEDIFSETKTPKEIIEKSVNYINSTTKMMLFSLWQLFTGKVDASDMHGVIAIVKVGGDIITSKGMLNGILLTAMISVNLAIMNFLPIPALDGGHVLFLVIEKITGRKPTKELSEKINSFFFILLILLMVAICYNDIFALVTKKL